VVVATNTDSGAADFDEACMLTIERLPLSSPEWGFRSMQGLRFYFQTVVALRKIIKKHNIDEIHCGRVIHEGVSAWLLSLFTKIKYICFVHGEDVETAAEKMGWTDKFVILTVGRLQKRKGQDKMIEAMPLILKDYPNALYVIVGNGDCKDKLGAMVHDLSLSEQVQILGDISDAEMIQCYQQCDLFILPNRTIKNDIEGFGMVLVEAQACAKPVIAGDSGGTKETMLVGETGSIIDCTCEKVIAKEICTYMVDPKRCEIMGRKGREHVEQHLDWDAHSKRAISQFNQT